MITNNIFNNVIYTELNNNQFLETDVVDVEEDKKI